MTTTASTTCNAPHPTDDDRLCNYDGPHHGAPHADGHGSWTASEDVSNDVHTRHLVVTLPNVSGEEADSIAETIDTEVLTDGFTMHGTVAHSLGATLLAGGLPGTRAKTHGDRVFLLDGTGNATHALDADDARQLAGALLNLAHTIDGK